MPTAIIGRVKRCPSCEATDLAIHAIDDSKLLGRIAAHTPGHGSVQPAKQRCPGSGMKMRMQKAKTWRAAKPEELAKPRAKLEAIRREHGRIDEQTAVKRLAAIADIIEAVDGRAVDAAIKKGEHSIIKATRLEMTNLEMRTIYELATNAVTEKDHSE